MGKFIALASRNRWRNGARVTEMLSAVWLDDRKDNRPNQTSGGQQQQRVAIARALATSPSLAQADEPTANLSVLAMPHGPGDTANDTQAMEIMQRLNEATGTAPKTTGPSTSVFATHDPRVVAFARRVVQLRDGRPGQGWHSAPSGRDFITLTGAEVP